MLPPVSSAFFSSLRPIQMLPLQSVYVTQCSWSDFRSGTVRWYSAGTASDAAGRVLVQQAVDGLGERALEALERSRSGRCSGTRGSLTATSRSTVSSLASHRAHAAVSEPGQQPIASGDEPPRTGVLGHPGRLGRRGAWGGTTWVGDAAGVA